MALFSSLEFFYNGRWLWLWLAVIFFITRALYSRQQKNLEPRWLYLLIFLRVSVLMMPLILLYKPQRVWEDITQKKSEFLLFVDRSLSMSITGSEFLDSKDRQRMQKTFGEDFTTLTRWQQQSQLVEKLRTKLPNQSLRLFTYGTNRTQINDTTNWNLPLEPHTRLTQSLGLTLGTEDSQSVSAVVIFGDGNFESPDKAASLIKNFASQFGRIPVHTLGLGSSQIYPDLKIIEFQVPEMVIKSQDPITFKATVETRGLKPEDPFEAKLFLGQELVSSQKLKASQKKRQDIVFEVILDQEGEFSYTLELKPVPDEKVLENNRQLASVQVKDEKIKVLYVDEFPRWDYRKITQFLERNPQTYASSMFLIQSSLRMPQRGSHPIRQLPQTFEKLWETTDVVMFGDVPQKFLEDADFINHLEKFVSSGGGLVFLTGPNHNPVRYNNKMLQDLYPTLLAPELSTRLQSIAKKKEFRLEVTQEGSNHPMTRLSPQEIWSESPPLRWFYRTYGLKPLTRVLLQHPTELCPLDQAPVPLMASMSYGAGRVLYVGFDELYRLRFSDDRDFIFNRFMSQLLNDLSAQKLSGMNENHRIEVDSDQIFLGDSVNVSVEFKGPGLSKEPLKLNWKIEPEKSIQVASLEPISGTQTFKGAFEPKKKGILKIWLEGHNQTKTLRVTDFSQEFEDSELKPEALQRLSGIQNYYDFNQIDLLADRLSSGQTFEAKRFSQNLLVEPFVWWLLGLMSTFLGLEWWIRKQQSLL